MPPRVRCKKSGAANAPYPSYLTDTSGEFAGLPHVLTVDAVKAGDMPTLGTSGMPVALEAYVPPEFRFWGAATAEAAKSTRDALVDAGIFTTENVVKVDGAHRVVVRRMFLAPVFEKAETPELATRAPALIQAAGTVVLTETGVAAIKGSLEDVSDFDPAGVPFLIEVDETAATVAAAKATTGIRAFKLATRPGIFFVTNAAPRAGAPHVVALEATPTVKRAVRLLAKADATEEASEERFVLGVVLEPDVVDSQNDTYDAATIRAAAHGFMQYHRNVGLQHELYVTGRIEILESYLAPVDMTIGTETVKAGTWLMGLRFVDEGLWKKVKSGELTGLSIGGTATREPDASEPDPSELAQA